MQLTLDGIREMGRAGSRLQLPRLPKTSRAIVARDQEMVAGSLASSRNAAYLFREQLGSLNLKGDRSGL
jgi:hypothetical protein